MVPVPIPEPNAPLLAVHLVVTSSPRTLPTPAISSNSIKAAFEERSTAKRRQEDGKKTAKGRQKDGNTSRLEADTVLTALVSRVMNTINSLWALVNIYRFISLYDLMLSLLFVTICWFDIVQSLIDNRSKQKDLFGSRKPFLLAGTNLTTRNACIAGN